MKSLLVGFVAGAIVAAAGFSIASHGSSPAAVQFDGLGDGRPKRCTPARLDHNRQLVRTFFAPGRSPQDAYAMMVPDYVQHNEGVKRFGRVNRLKDREAFKAIDEILTSNGQRPELLAPPGQPKNEMAFKIIATCDYVVAVHRTYVPDPQKIGGFYPAFDFELWRISDGKFAEHWDSQRIPVPVPELMRAPLVNSKQ
ncbi:hypothetical protein [Sphingomonas sp. 2SG]|uniref:hypothetical protein n=1 Tax=Sphingomonas sp. 2SG TaxID=2502201 RepID=UPI0010FA1B44|nr:hypothetical protein [Sphingomonas sp. 2SG]